MTAFFLYLFLRGYIMALKPEIRKALRGARTPDSYIGIRASHIEKRAMQNAAKSLGLNLTQYILGLHRHATQKRATDAS